MNNKVIYLDNNATTAVDQEAFEAMRPFLTERYGNPSSIHTFGGSVAADIENARRHVAELIGADFRDRDNNASEIIFTSCGTESDNSAIHAALAANPARKKIVTSEVEHPAILHCCKELERQGIETVYVPVDGKGRLDEEFFAQALDDNTALATVMWANNETGTIFPVEKLAEIAHKKGVLFHTDAVQATGKIPIDLAHNQIDMLSISGHKLHAPKGVGVLYVRRGFRFRPFVLGGHQEKGRRGGTENVASIIALGKACETVKANMISEIAQLTRLRNRLEEKIQASIPNIRINGDLESRLPNTSSISFEYIEGESILMLLNLHHICASSGSACTTGSLEPSHVLRAMKLPYTAAHGTIRFSLSKYNTQEEIDYTAEVLPAIISRLREISPYWKGAQSK